MKHKLDERWRPELEIVAKEVCRSLELPYDRFISKDRHKELIVARKYYTYIVREMFPMIPFAHIASLLGADHATSIHHYQSMVLAMDIYEEDRDAVNMIMNTLIPFDAANSSKALMMLEHAYFIDQSTFNWTPPETK